MKSMLIIAAVLFVGALAQDATTVATPPEVTIAPFKCDGNPFLCKIKEMAHHAKFHFTNLGKKLLDVGSSVLGAAAEHGKNLLVTGGQALLGTILEHLNKSGLVGKREVSFFNKIGEFVQNGMGFLAKLKDHAQGKLAGVLKSLTDLMRKMTLKGVEEEDLKKIDELVEKYEKEGGLKEMVTGLKDQMKAIFGNVWEKFKAGFNKDTEKRAIVDMFNNAKDAFTGLLGKLTETFKPHIDAVKDLVSGVASKAQEHANNLLEAAKGHFNALKDKLSGHIETLKGHAGKLMEHGKNALGALKEAVTSIIQQTAGNVKDAVKGAIDTGKDAAGVVKDHFMGTTAAAF